MRDANKPIIRMKTIKIWFILFFKSSIKYGILNFLFKEYLKIHIFEIMQYDILTNKKGN